MEGVAWLLDRLPAAENYQLAVLCVNPGLILLLLRIWYGVEVEQVRDAHKRQVMEWLCVTKEWKMRGL